MNLVAMVCVGVVLLMAISAPLGTAQSRPEVNSRSAVS